MKIISWNVNGIRAVVQKWFLDFIKNESPDILAIQETKAFEDQFLKEVGVIPWYKYIWHSGKTAWYAGTAIFYKDSLNVVDMKSHFWEIEHFHDDGRITELKLPWITLINGYFPNGWTRADGTEMLTYKLEFYDKLIDYCNILVKNGENVIILWDFNICHEEIDIARPKENEDSIGFLPVERAKVSEFLSNGYIDTFRHFYPEKRDVYSWWSYRAGARPRNVGWRIDYFVVNKNFIQNVKSVEYMTSIMWSDHCPVKIEIL